jgi:hypothetical protein
MVRTLLAFAASLAVFALAAARANEQVSHGYDGDGYHAATARAECVPNYPGYVSPHYHPGHHGHGPHGVDLHDGLIDYYGKRRAQASWYPNQYDNYGLPNSPKAYGGDGGCRTCSTGQCQYRFYGQPDLFYNYYAWPQCSGWGAELYLSPRPVPPHVGHTYYTYQPLYPHEFLYEHHRTYHRYYNGGQGLNRTSVIWYSPFWQCGK